MTRLKTVAMAGLAAWLLAGCTKEQAFSNPNTGTIRELGFEWNEEYSACLNSDDLTEMACGTALWLDGERVVLELPSPGKAVQPAGEVVLKKAVGFQTVLYRYLPATRSVILYLEGGEVLLQWKEDGRCFKGDVLDQDLLTICRGGAAA